ncbi:SDR family NAD(P)-dependent oxidoreductase [Paenibacillus sp. JNUCC-31]|uniref:SDR family NAD(P)-dependent oxidoreductase n=1 Tax=unclassified Paenibacillus TaxID=185978 RepID=UPI00177EEC36|nr:SDR family oxidoreductase [Paenibacillus sp. JNUCC-31]QOS79379.1 SDR family oxidoreductase [Paenibacillus sp. JNUCC-31]
MEQNTEKKVVLITGGSRGIGAATALVLAERGFRVVVNYAYNAERANEIVEQISEKGGEAIAIKADVRRPDEVNLMVNEILSIWGGIDALVNNASMSFVIKPFQEMTWEEFSQKLNDEMMAAFTMTKAATPSMIQNRYGRIVHVASGLAKNPAPGMIAHGTAKAGLVQFAKYTAQELGANGITVNVISPGLVDTEASANQPQQFRDQLAEMTPVGRIASAEDVAKAIAMYVSDDCQFITGVYVPVDGGITMV